MVFHSSADQSRNENRREPTITNAVQVFNNQGLDEYQKGNLGRAIADFTEYNRAIEINPALAVAYLNRAQVWREKGNLQEAEADLRIALRIDPNFEEASEQLFSLWLESSRTQADRAVEISGRPARSRQAHLSLPETQ